ncbi:unnamed protein product, partial [Brachionus calyciflorus]
EDSCVPLEFNQTYTDQIIIFSTRTIVEITTLAPNGFSKSPIENYNNNASLWYINITWTPDDPSLIGVSLFCFQ